MKTPTGRNAKYTLSVGNIGNMYYSNKKEALRDFAFYKECSINLHGRVGGESVYLTDIHGTIMAEYIGTIEEE